MSCCQMPVWVLSAKFYEIPPLVVMRQQLRQQGQMAGQLGRQLTLQSIMDLPETLNRGKVKRENCKP
jgi:hypothetical protein